MIANYIQYNLLIFLKYDEYLHQLCPGFRLSLSLICFSISTLVKKKVFCVWGEVLGLYVSQDVV